MILTNATCDRKAQHSWSLQPHSWHPAQFSAAVLLHRIVIRLRALLAEKLHWLRKCVSQKDAMNGIYNRNFTLISHLNFFKVDHMKCRSELINERFMENVNCKMLNKSERFHYEA